ncbi:MAG: methyl-accepting chemotaxis protein [Candidatus Binatia bacterium]
MQFSIVTKYTLIGVLFGCCFPLGATAFDVFLKGEPWTIAGILASQRVQPLHWVIDSAPLFLGVLAFMAGRRAQEVWYYQEFFGLSLNILGMASVDGYFKRLNPAAEKILGFSRVELMAKPFTDLVHPQDREATRTVIQRLGDGESIVVFENRCLCKGGSYKWIRWHAKSVVREQLIYTVAIEITDEKQRQESLQRQIAEMKERALILSQSLGQIVSSVAQLSETTTDTATAVAQTVTTVEQVKQTAYVASQKAQEVSASAQKATEVAQSGEHVVENARAGLSRAREQIRSIADSVLKFGEQTQAISEIITSVNELAEQSNLLAINAAIEAANAGENGKGFGIVAREVKRLAEQSKQATAQVRVLLSEIQKASTAAVLVTEQGAKAVEAGVQQSLEAGESIRTLTNAIVEASYAVTQIAVSSQQQLVGMDQVAQAMQNIRKASTQNTDGIKQVEDAVRALQGVGQFLQTGSGSSAV